MIHEEKARAREEILKEFNPLDSVIRYPWGKAAERLRRMAAYRGATSIYTSLDQSLHQVKLNALADGKHLVLPTPNVQKGFVLLDPKMIPLKRLYHAIRVDLQNPFLRKLPYDRLPPRPIDMIVTTALAVGENGTRIGDGNGYLDLQYAILSALGWLSPSLVVVAIVSEGQVRPSLPTEPTDVGVHWIVTPERAFPTGWGEISSPGIVWKNLTEKTVRRNDALYFLRKRNRNSTLPS